MTDSDQTSCTGYRSFSYLQSLREIGEPVRLEACNGWLLRRNIPASPYSDFTGPYPLFGCDDWGRVGSDLMGLSNGVCAVLVTDPLGNYSGSQLDAAFPDLNRPFKEHFVVELDKLPASYPSGHHRRNIRRAAKLVDSELCSEPQHAGDEWVTLYENLKRRHRIRGPAAFSPRSLREQLGVPGILSWRATVGADLVGMMLIYAEGDTAYYHLAAYSDAGYEARASYALFDAAIRYLREHRFRRLCLGAGAGIVTDASDGLNRFKLGWSTTTRMAYICGRILDRDAYLALSESVGEDSSGFFPAYRTGEYA